MTHGPGSENADARIGDDGYPEKIRLRTDDELRLQAEGLKEVRDILVGLDIPYFVGGGTLLGIVRDGDFIRWDWDVEVDTITEEAFPRAEKLIEALKFKGFEIQSKDSTFENFKINAVKFGARYEIQGYFQSKEDPEMMRRRGYQIPTRFFSGDGQVRLRGETYRCFYPQEEYLEFNYKDWRTPMRTMDKSVYLSDASVRNKNAGARGQSGLVRRALRKTGRILGLSH